MAQIRWTKASSPPQELEGGVYSVLNCTYKVSIWNFVTSRARMKGQVSLHTKGFLVVIEGAAGDIDYKVQCIVLHNSFILHCIVLTLYGTVLYR